MARNLIAVTNICPITDRSGKSLEGVTVKLTNAGTATPATIYLGLTGATTIPNASPTFMVTDLNGIIYGYLEDGYYDVEAYGGAILNSTGPLRVAVGLGSGSAPSIAQDSLTSFHIAENAIGASELADNSVAAANIIDGVVGTSEIANLAVTDAKVATANKDGAIGTPSMRTLGTGIQQAARGSDVVLKSLFGDKGDILSASADDAPAVLSSVGVPDGYQLIRQANAATGLTWGPGTPGPSGAGGMFERTISTTDPTIGATALTLNTAPELTFANVLYAVIKPFTLECEVRQVDSINGAGNTIINFGPGLTYDHAIGEKILFVYEPTVYVGWWGAKPNIAADQSVAINRAYTSMEASSDVNKLVFAKGVYWINNPIDIPFTMWLIGQGYGTIIKAMNTFNTNSNDPNVAMIRTKSGGAGNPVIRYTGATTMTQTYIWNVWIDGNRQHATENPTGHTGIVNGILSAQQQPASWGEIVVNACSGYGIALTVGQELRLKNIEILRCEVGLDIYGHSFVFIDNFNIEQSRNHSSHAASATKDVWIHSKFDQEVSGHQYEPHLCTFRNGHFESQTSTSAVGFDIDSGKYLSFENIHFSVNATYTMFDINHAQPDEAGGVIYAIKNCYCTGGNSNTKLLVDAERGDNRTTGTLNKVSHLAEVIGQHLNPTADPDTLFYPYEMKGLFGRRMRMGVPTGTKPMLELDNGTLDFTYPLATFKTSLGGGSAPGIYMGVGSPNGAALSVAPRGSLYINISGGATATLWVKEAVGNNWAAK